MSKGSIINVNPAKVEVPSALYPRSRQPEEKDVEHLRDLGGEWHTRPVTARKGTVLVDGAHRMLAAQLDGLTSVSVVDLGQLSDEDILREAIERNATHGKQLSLVEKRNLAQKMVGEMGVGELAKLFAVSERTVSRWIGDVKADAKANAIAKARKMLEAGKSMTAIAKELGIARSTLKKWLEEPDPTTKSPESDESSTPKTSGSPSAKSKTRSSTWGQPYPPSETEIPYDSLMEETKDAISMIATGIIGEIKGQLRESDNPDGLHWSDFARFVIAEIVQGFPKK